MTICSKTFIILYTSGITCITVYAPILFTIQPHQRVDQNLEFSLHVNNKNSSKKYIAHFISSLNSLPVCCVVIE